MKCILTKWTTQTPLIHVITGAKLGDLLSYECGKDRDGITTNVKVNQFDVATVAVFSK